MHNHATANPSVASTGPFVKFHLSQAEGNVVTGSGPGWVRVGPTSTAKAS